MRQRNCRNTPIVVAEETGMRLVHQKGFSLVELMVALVAGLIVSGAVLTFTVSSLQTNTEYVKATRLTQNLREVVDFTSRELRRAGYDQVHMDQLAQNPGSVTVSPFAPVFIDADGDCVIYAIDFDPEGDGSGAGVVDLANGEIRAIRLVTATVNEVDVGVIESAQSDADGAPDCADPTADYDSYPAACEGLWCPLSDPRTIDVTEFLITRTTTDIAAPTSTSLAMQIRELAVVVTASLRSDGDVERSLNTRVRVRADCVRNNLASCSTAPSGI
jgi:prepilin-type N-terminal cleavage/methylation domain-containing protein